MKEDELVMDKATWLDRLSRFDQAHLLDFWDDLDAMGQSRLIDQLERIDFARIHELVRGHDAAPDWSLLAAQAEPPRAIRLHAAENEFSADAAIERGEESLAAGEVGLILVAGGQGTRLGFDSPKGLLRLGPLSGRTLFQILIERLRAVSRRYGVRIPLYVMTSPATHDETVTFLSQHQRFGLDDRDLRIFCQGVMPAVDAVTGQLLLAERDALALSPDGHGGMLAAMDRSGCLEDAASRHIQQLFYCQIDNPLAQVCDPLLIGYHVLAGSDMTTQVVQKQAADERVGNVVAIGGRTQIIEYSDLPADVGQRTHADGSLRLWAGNLAIHVFERAFLEASARQADALPFHRAKKQVPYVDPSGATISPDVPNAVKFERFIFDLLPLARNAIVVEAETAAAFAPVKNAAHESRDTAATAQAAMVARDAKLLRDAGAVVAPGILVEVSPLWALDASQAAGRIPPGYELNEPKYFAPDDETDSILTD